MLYSVGTHEPFVSASKLHPRGACAGARNWLLLEWDALWCHTFMQAGPSPHAASTRTYAHRFRQIPVMGRFSPLDSQATTTCTRAFVEYQTRAAAEEGAGPDSAACGYQTSSASINYLSRNCEAGHEQPKKEAVELTCQVAGADGAAVGPAALKRAGPGG